MHTLEFGHVVGASNRMLTLALSVSALIGSIFDHLV